MRGFRLLVHAEIEYYPEIVAKETAIQKLQEWKSSKKLSELLICLLAALHVGLDTELLDSSPLLSSTRPKKIDRVDTEI